MRTRRSPNRSPGGFTLIELLVVIVILTLLIGLLVPAVMRAVTRAKEATVAADIQTLSQALASFKTRYGEYPPSRIVIAENGDYSAANLGNFAPLASRSITSLKRYWPRLSLSTSGPASGIPGGAYDVNGNGSTAANFDPPYVLMGPECLVFFLGGIPQQTGAGWAMTGFAKNPANPFQTATATNNRVPPDFEFNNGRLVTNTLNPYGPPGGFPGYIDAFGLSTSNVLSPQIDPGYAIPFLTYFSAYGGAGYDANDTDLVNPNFPSGQQGETDSVNGAVLVEPFTAPGNIVIGATTQSSLTTSPTPNPYTSSPPVATDSSGNVNTASPKPRIWVNPTSFQIVSAGADRYFGIGGQWAQTGSIRLPFVDASKGGYTLDSYQTQQLYAAGIGQSQYDNAIRSRESDNITNFAGGRLD